jgi:hypothetical protein
MEEVWKTVEEFPKYQVSTFGNVRNVKKNKVVKITQKCGYNVAILRNNETGKSFRVHRLVAIAFIENSEKKLEVNHKDKNKLNNCVSNLEWNTRTENNIHRVKNLQVKTNRNKCVFRIDPETNEKLEVYDSIELAGQWALVHGFTKTSHNGRNAIGNCIQSLSKKAYGYKWLLENTNEDLEEELWKEVVLDKNNPEEIKESNRTCFISNLGRFKNSYGIIMSNYKVNDSGYMRVFIYGKTYSIHRLVALAFIENTENKQQVNHKDGNKLNNALSNLEWCTNQENQIHKFQTGLGNNFKRKITQYDLEMNKIKDFDSIVGASKELTIGYTNIRGVLSGYRKTAGGFIFKYLEEE